nr:polyhydroxyalkanoic acid system family protein [uncultured Albidiferax sp.]
MTDIHMQREHSLGLPAARKLANDWLEQAETRLGMTCEYTEGTAADEISFRRAGVTGTVQITDDRFVLDAELGFLWSAFKDKIEAEVARRMDKMLTQVT